MRRTFPLRFAALFAGVVLAGIRPTAPASPADPKAAADLSGPAPLGFSPGAWDDQRVLEERFAALLEAKRISATHRALTERPHRAGTEGGRRVALLVRAEAAKNGFRTEIATYLSYNTHPGPASIALTAPIRKSISLVEDSIPGDRFTSSTADHRAFCAFSGSGQAEGDVVFAGQGTAEDFRALEEKDISLAGRVALMRYFGEGEGIKVLRAQERGAVAAILYADPADDGFRQGPVYPRGNWRPPGSIMRRSLSDLPYEGDALTPGWAAKPGARSLRPGQVEGLPKIPVLPISYRDAALILSHLEGAAAPERMQGGCAPPGTPGAGVPGPDAARLLYRLGPGPARVRLSVRMEPRRDPVRNVIVTIPGNAEPDVWILVGTHHDAWIYGAGDPSSGTAAQLEVLRALGRLRQKGWRPRRTLVFAFWDFEEMNLGGSAEWAEDHADELRRKGAAVINMDSAVFNTERPLYVDASPCLQPLFREVAAAMPGPRAGESLAAAWLRMQNETRALHSVEASAVDEDPRRPFDRPSMDPVPLGDDQTPFVEFLAIPGSDMFYGADYGMYHSIYENRRWMETVVDPGFRHHLLMAELQGRLALRLAMAPVLPLEARGTAAAWESAFDALTRRAADLDLSGRSFTPVRRALRRFRDAADEFAAIRDRSLAAAGWDARDRPAVLASVNREVAAVERSFFTREGLPGHPWYRGLWVAPPRPVPGLDDARLPGLRWPLERKEAETLARQVIVYRQALDEATAHLHRAADLLAPSGGRGFRGRI